METEFARAKHLSQRVQIQKLKVGVRRSTAKKRARQRKKDVSASARPARSSGEVEASAPRVKRTTDDNVFCHFGPFVLKKILAGGEFSSLSAECKQHHTTGDANDCARSIKLSSSMSVDRAALLLKKWLVAGAAINEDFCCVLVCLFMCDS